ncbi:MAG: hypothetical protein AAGF12_07470 [Myxococcota bacterium]
MKTELRRVCVGCGLLVALSGCGGEETGEAPPTPVTPAVPTENPAPPGETPTETPGESPSEPSPTPAPSEPVSAVETPAPEPATGCPATSIEEHLERAGTVYRPSIQGDETLDLAGSPHRFPHGMNIAENATVTLEPCALVFVGAGRTVLVGAGALLVANGEEGRPVRFDSEATDPAPGQWHGIDFHRSSRPGSRLVHTIIEDAGGATVGAAVTARNDVTVDLRHVAIRHSRMHGVRLENEARFSDESTALTVADSGQEDPYSAPVWFYSASQVKTLPEGSYTGNAYDEIWVERAEVRSNASWRNPGVRYRLNRGLAVGSDNGAVLTVAAGTTLAFSADTALDVGTARDGALVADGATAETPVTFVSARPVPAAGDWRGIVFGRFRSDAGVRLNHVVVSHAGAEVRNVNERNSCRTTFRAGITILDHDLGPRVTHAVFRKLPSDAAAVLLGFRGDATDYTAAEHGNDFSAADVTCRQNLQPEGDCPDPACR